MMRSPSVVSIPVALLLDWRSPDRDIHRLLVTRGTLTTTEIKQSLGVARHVAENALSRMGRLGVVRPVAKRQKSVQNRQAVLWAATCVPSQAVCVKGLTRQRVRVAQPRSPRFSVRRAA
jgi:hypothetical protein